MSRYIYPPRTKCVIKPSQLPDYEKEDNWIAQRKYNGDRCLIQLSENEVFLWNRYGKRQKYQLLSPLRQELLSLVIPMGGETWIDGELLHSKVPDTIVMFDILQLGGEYLHSTPQEKRLEIIYELCGEPNSSNSLMGHSISEHLFLAQNWTNDFVSHYDAHIMDDLIEGLILRQKGSFLGSWGSAPYEVKWMIRCRKPSKNYRF